MSNLNTANGLQDLTAVLKDVEKKVLENRSKYEDSQKAVKDFRRIFDQASSRMNKAIFNDRSEEDIYHETLHTVSSLIEILARVKKK